MVSSSCFNAVKSAGIGISFLVFGDNSQIRLQKLDVNGQWKTSYNLVEKQQLGLDFISTPT